jgi:hypothetical protein
MPSAQHSFVLLWKRAVAALSLIVAALIAPTAPAPVSGAGMAGARAGSGPAIAGTANALVAAVDGLAEGGGRPALQELQGSGPQAKPCVLAAWHDFPLPQIRPASPSSEARKPHPAFAARAGLTRAPPQA